MARNRRPNPIDVADLTEFLDNHSDFTFEIKVLKMIRGESFECEHHGSYDDPVTKKPREFDIRARRDFGNRIIRLAVECKNLRENYPLLVSCMPRRDDEAFHEIALSIDPEKFTLRDPQPYAVRAFEPSSKSLRLMGARSLYAAGDPVGKSCAQVGKTDKGDITATDADVYQKWAQALSSAHDLTYEACHDAADRPGGLAPVACVSRPCCTGR
jgi:hypothetical protein